MLKKYLAFCAFRVLVIHTLDEKYFHRLRHETCPLEARIVGIVDVYDALTERRVYKEPWPVGAVVKYFRENAGITFDPQLCSLLLDNFAEFERIRTSEVAS